MIRVVADTNVFISALMFGGLPGAFLDLAFLQLFQLATSAVLLDELDRKLRGKFAVSAEDAGQVRLKLERNALIVHPEIRIEAVADDPDDNRVLECAVAAKANMIVSGDRHLRKLGSFDSIPIMTVRQFMDAFEVGTIG